jgi:hypothetical protein
MAVKVKRATVDLSAYPDPVVIYPGMRVNSLRGLKTLARLGPGIKAAVAAKPDGLLLHEDLFFSLWPLHPVIRQYWRDFESRETWARSTMPHQNGEKTSCATPAERDSGTKPTSAGVVSRRSTMTFLKRSG